MLSSTKNRKMSTNHRLLKHIPQKLIDDLLYSEFVNLSVNDKAVVGITNRNLFELKNQEILCSVELCLNDEILGNSVINGR